MESPICALQGRRLCACNKWVVAILDDFAALDVDLEDEVFVSGANGNGFGRGIEGRYRALEFDRIVLFCRKANSGAERNGENQ